MTKGLRIKQLREARNLTQEDLAKLLSTKRQTISKYEKGIVTNIPSDRIEELAKILGTTPEYILGWEESGEEQKKPGDEAGLTENQRYLIDFARSLSEEQAVLALRILKSIVEAD